MRRLFLAVFLAACTRSAAPTPTRTPTTKEEHPRAVEAPRDLLGKPGPAFRVPTITGGSIAVPTGKVTALVFVGGWSYGSSMALGQLEVLHHELGARGLAVVAVGMDETLDQLREFVESRRATYTVGWDPWGKDVASRWAQSPYSENSVFVLDRRGVVRHVEPGGKDGCHADDPRVREAIERLLAEP